MKKVGLVAGIVALGLFGGGAAFAHEDDHGELHQELDQTHQLEHGQLEAQHEQFHAREQARHQWMMARCDGDPRCEWLVTRRETRRHRLEHYREALEHGAWHNDANAEHDTYHEYEYGVPQVGRSYPRTPRGW